MAAEGERSKAEAERGLLMAEAEAGKMIVAEEDDGG